MTFKQMRIAAGLTQFQMAVEMGCSLPTVQKYERGDSVSPELLPSAVKVAKKYGIDGFAPNCPCCGRPL